jgi:Phage integrase, N-terminal SAM-like domain
VRAHGESVAPKPKLRFGEVADCWLAGPVVDLRETTQVKYRCMVNQHLRPRFEARRLDAVNADDLARLALHCHRLDWHPDLTALRAHLG